MPSISPGARYVVSALLGVAALVLPETGWVDQETARLAFVLVALVILVLIVPPIFAWIRPGVELTRPEIRFTSPEALRAWRARQSSPASPSVMRPSSSPDRDDNASAVGTGREPTSATVDSGPSVLRPIAPKAVGRVVVKETPEDLLAFFEEHPPDQAALLVKPWIGAWMKVSGRVHTVEPFRGLRQVTFEPGGSLNHLFMYFGDEERLAGRPATLKRGEEIEVIGRISVVNASWVDLEDCELVEP